MLYSEHEVMGMQKLKTIWFCLGLGYGTLLLCLGRLFIG